ncbi:MAG: MotA/TolQ/ExbB proton channel family protein [Alphaproteobacteria bacterium]
MVPLWNTVRGRQPASATIIPVTPAEMTAGDGDPPAALGPIAMLEQALGERRAAHDRLRHRLLLRFVVLNLGGFALVGAAYGQGWIDTILKADGSGLSLLMGALFLFGLGLAAHRAVRISRELNLVRAFDPLFPSRVRQYLDAVRARSGGSRALSAGALKLRLADRLGGVRYIANALVIIGLIGTVLGFIMALGGVTTEGASSAEAIGPMVTTLIEGMSVALYTTLVGAVLNLWLNANHRLLMSGTVSLVAAIIDLGERHARD